MTVTFINASTNERKEFAQITFYFNHKEGHQSFFQAALGFNGIIIEYGKSYRLYNDLLHEITVILKDEVSYVKFHTNSYEDDKQEKIKLIEELAKIRKFGLLRK